MSETIILPPGAGRAYEIGPMRGVFKADEEGYCASEWSVAPHGTGPGAHSHPEQDEVFIVTEGTMWFLVDEAWVEAPTRHLPAHPGAGHPRLREPRRHPRRRVQRLLPGHHFEARFAAWAS